MEQLDQLGRNGRVVVERGPHVVFGIADAHLAQVFRQGPHHGNVAPAEAGRQHQCVVAVAFRLPQPHGHEQGFETALQIGRKLDAAALGRFQRHFMQIAEGHAGWRDPVGTLVDDLEAHVFQQRHAGRQRDRSFQMEHLQRQARIRRAGAAEEGDRRLTALRQAFDLLHVRQRVFRVVDFLVAAVEGERIAVRQALGHFRAEVLLEGIHQPVRPGADDGGNGLFQLVLRHRRRLAAGAADDEMHPRHRAFRIGHIPGRQVAIEDMGKIGADVEAHFRGVAVTRHVAEDRDVTVELLRPGQHADARALIQLQDRHGEVVERLVINLEKLVPREGFHHVGEGTARVAVRIKPGLGQDIAYLAPQEGDRARRLVIGGGGKQADDAQLAGHLAGGVKHLGADVVHVDAPVHAALHIGLGDDQRVRAHQELADLRGDLHEFTTAAQNAHVRIGQKPEAGAVDRRQLALARAAVKGIFAHAEEDEIVIGHPFKELDRFPQLVAGAVGLRGLVGVHRLGQALAHGLPVGNSGAHVIHDACQALLQPGAGLLIDDAADVDMDHAFLMVLPCCAALVAAERHELALRAALHVVDRVQHQMDGQLAVMQLGHDRIHQERHVVIDQFDDRHLTGHASLGLEGRVRHADAAGAPRVGPEVLERGTRESGQLVRRVGDKIFCSTLLIKFSGKIREAGPCRLRL